MFSGDNFSNLPFFKVIGDRLIFNKFSGYKLRVYDNLLNEIDLNRVNQLCSISNSAGARVSELSIAPISFSWNREKLRGNSGYEKINLITVANASTKQVHLIASFQCGNYDLFNVDNLSVVLDGITSYKLLESILNGMNFTLKSCSFTEGNYYFRIRKGGLSVIIKKHSNSYIVGKVFVEDCTPSLGEYTSRKYKFLEVVTGKDLKDKSIKVAVAYNKFLFNDFLSVFIGDKLRMSLKVKLVENKVCILV